MLTVIERLLARSRLVDTNPANFIEALSSSQSGRRRRACALASVRRSNCTCGFPACSFHEDTWPEM